VDALDWSILCERLESFIDHAWKHEGLARPRAAPVSRWLAGRFRCDEKVEFVWIEFLDSGSPRAVGIRMKSACRAYPHYEIAECDRCGHIYRSEWRLTARYGWQRIGTSAII
jgi:hypothetical protein